MNYVISLNFDQEVPYYMCFNENDSWNECFSPINATQFKKVKTAIEWATQKTTMGDYAKAVKYTEAKEAFDKWVADGMIRRKFAAINRSISRKYDPEKDDKMAVLQWHCEVANKGELEILFEDYETWPDLFSVFECLWGVSTFSTYDDKPNTITFQVRVSKKTKFDTFKEELDLILDKVTFLDDGNIVLPIFDHYLSEHGNSVSLVKHNDLWEIQGRYYSLLEDTSLEKCFEYIKKHRYYDNGEDDNQED